MKKKILSAILCATTLFSAVGFSACEVTDVLFADYKGQIAEMQETLNAQQEKIADFESDVAQLQEAINEKEEQIADFESDVAGLQGIINEQQEQIAELQELINSKQEQIATLEQEKEDLQGVIVELQEEIKALEQKVQDSANKDNTDGIVHGGIINSSSLGLGSAMIAYKMPEVVSATEDYISFEIAISDFALLYRDIIEPVVYVTLTVANSEDLNSETILQRIDGKDFTSKEYGWEYAKDESGNSFIKYKKYEKYNVPISLLSGDSGILVFTTIQHISDNSSKNGTMVAVRYEYKNGNIHFSVA